MKKTFILLLANMFSLYGLLAQVPDHRTNTTVVVDALAQLPTKDAIVSDQIFQEIAGVGEEGVIQIMNLYDATGKSDNTKFYYVLAGLTNYVVRAGNLKQKETLVNAYVKILDEKNDTSIKVAIINQLGVVGENATVFYLRPYLDDENLCASVSQSLASINTTLAVESLQAGLQQNNSDCLLHIIDALGQTNNSLAEQDLLNTYTKVNTTIQEHIVNALGQLGTRESLKTVEESQNYSANLNLIRRLIEQGDIKDANKALVRMKKVAENSGNISLQLDVFATFLMLDTDKVASLLKEVMENPDKKIRSKALLIASQYPSRLLLISLIQLADKGSAEQKKEILDCIATISLQPQNANLIEDSIFPDLLAYINNVNIDICRASANVLVNIDNDIVSEEFIRLLQSSDTDRSAIGRDALEVLRGNNCQQISNAIQNASEYGKISALKLLSTKKCNNAFDIVSEETQSELSGVKNVAYSVLKDVATIENLSTLYNLLESAPIYHVAEVQNAISQVLSSDCQIDASNLVLERMGVVADNKINLYYPILAKIPGYKSLEALQEVFEMGDANLSSAAFNAILQRQTTDVLNLLFTICVNSISDDLFNQALDRYIELVCSETQTGENRRLYLEKALQIAKTDTQKQEILKGLESTDSYIGLLLAGAYLDYEPCQQIAANTVVKLALNNKDFTSEEVVNYLNKALHLQKGVSEKNAIKEHLTLIENLQGYTSIFNGQNLDGWKGLVGNPLKRAQMSKIMLKKEQVKADKQMAMNWKAEDNMIVYYGSGYDNLCTMKQYANFEMLVDWRLDPEGHEPDAGIYLRGTPQVQIWDIARTNVGAEVGSGGLYNNQTYLSKPLCVADNALGEWNTLYIKMVGDRVTVKLNGILVVDNIILENYWDRKQPIPPLEQIELQAHGCKVFYRNLYIKELPSVTPYQLSTEEEREGYRVLFDGTNMHQWTGNTVDYIIEDGSISMHPTSRFGGNLYTKDEFGDFIYRFEFQMTPGANNGVGIRTPMEGDAAYVGMEIQVLDHDAPIYNDITPLQVHGSVYGIIGADRISQKPIGEWNYEEIRAVGDHITVTLNGVVILDGNIRDAVLNGTPDGLDHPGLFNTKGHIAFLGHGSPVKFRNIRIREISNKKTGGDK